MDDSTRRLLDSIPAGTVDLPRSPSNVFAWPTEKCAVACRHCNFGSVARASDQRSVSEGDELARWCAAAGASTLVLCGGGEPLEELDFCRGAFRTAAACGLPMAIYTSGFIAGRDASTILDDLTQEGHPKSIWFRLSVDHFHTERIGVEPVADWLTTVTERHPTWRVSLRTLRVEHDRSLDALANCVGGVLRQMRGGKRLVLRSGRQVVVESRGVVFDGRATPVLIAKAGLSLPDDDAARLRSWGHDANDKGQVGRLLSRRLTVGRARVDLEIHADGSVHVLESQPADHRMRFVDREWADLAESYYRDPFIHTVARSGLDGVAEVISLLKHRCLLRPEVLAHSIEGLSDLEARQVRAHLVLSGPTSDLYSDGTKQLAAQILALST